MIEVLEQHLDTGRIHQHVQAFPFQLVNQITNAGAGIGKDSLIFGKTLAPGFKTMAGAMKSPVLLFIGLGFVQIFFLQKHQVGLREKTQGLAKILVLKGL